jgi:hypothetical protein
MRIPRDFYDTIPVEPARLAARAYSAPIVRVDRWINRLVNVLLAVGIATGLAWWLWEWAAQCTELLTCGLALVRPVKNTAQSVNEQRLHAAVDAAFKNGHTHGYEAGFRAGARFGRVLHIGAGVVIGAALVALALHLGVQAGSAL